MSSFVVYEAFFAGLKEGLKAGIIWYVLASLLHVKGMLRLQRAFIAGTLFSVIAAASFLFLNVTPEIREYIANSGEMSFALLLVASAAALLNSSGLRLFSLLDRVSGKAFLRNSAIFAASAIFFVPDISGTFIFIKDLSLLNERAYQTYASLAAGVSVSVLLISAMSRLLSRGLVSSFFELPQLLLFASMMKLTAGGTGGISEISLIPAVQRGLMKLSHDIIHQTFVMLMVPDHPLLKTTTWNFIGFFFGPNIASWETLLLFLLCPLMFIYYSLASPLPETAAAAGAERRRFVQSVLSDRRRKAVPVLLFVLLISASWFSQSGEKISAVKVPKAKPVVEDRGMVLIPVTDPTMDLKDGSLHKFVLSRSDKEIRIMVIMKPDGRISVCLDACEICPPDGYGLREDHVVCLYCNTPIPVVSLGEPGGCNPIPLAFAADDRFIRIAVDEIMKKRELINSSRSAEAAR